MNYKKVLEEIQKKQLLTFSSVKDFKNNKTLKSHKRGLYWIWTDLSFSDLKKITTPQNTKYVPIAELVEEREGLVNICDISNKGFKIVYNGIGGYREKPIFGLRERINQELNCNDHRTGTLNLINRDGINIYNLAISYFDFDDSDNSIIMENLTYLRDAKNIEMNWRIEFGIPILTRH
jgi:hypothetical protein